MKVKVCRNKKLAKIMIKITLINLTFLPIFFIGVWPGHDFDIYQDDDPSTFDYAKI